MISLFHIIGIMLYVVLVFAVAWLVWSRQRERIHYERELAIKERYRIVFDKSPFGMVHVDARGCIVYANPAFCAMVGYKLQDLVGVHFRQITYFEDINADEGLFARVNSGELPYYDMEKRYERGDDNSVLVYVHLWVFPVPPIEGDKTYVLAIVQNETPMQAAKEEIEQQRRENEQQRQQIQAERALVEKLQQQLLSHTIKKLEQ